ncbi:unnamed protein product [Lymnaea stagnalis]|uniref:Uncharacterized protein n=1 Tax=Lymnaea stagnalis TaxID=6523 RepID=A0AAV2H348_LYMST
MIFTSPLWFALVILIGTSAALTGISLKSTNYPRGEVVHEWSTLEYDWPSDEVKADYIKRGWYEPNRSLLSGIDVYNDEIYVTALRITPDVPSGLNKVVVKNGRSLLQPFPSLAANELGKCESLQSPFASQTDPKTGLMYVLDVGRTWRGPPNPYAPCPPKLVVFDLKKQGALVRKHEFPESLVPKNVSILDDLVLDYVTRKGQEVKYIYITDVGSVQIIVFDLETNSSWSFFHESMKTDEDSIINIDGVNYPQMQFPVDGIAIDPDFLSVYYCPVGGKKLFQIPTSVLRDPYGDFACKVRLLGNKISNADGLASGQSSIFYGALTLNAVYKWERLKDREDQGVPEGGVTMVTQTEVVQNVTTYSFVDSLKVDDKGYLWFTSNRAHLYQSATMDFSGASGSNFRVCRVYVGEYSYLWKGPAAVVG